MSDQDSNDPYGFTWGNVSVTRITHIEGRGRTIAIRPVGKSYGDGVSVYVSEAGRSVRVFKNGKELR